MLLPDIKYAASLKILCEMQAKTDTKVKQAAAAKGEYAEESLTECPKTAAIYLCRIQHS